MSALSFTVLSMSSANALSMMERLSQGARVSRLIIFSEHSRCNKRQAQPSHAAHDTSTRPRRSFQSGASMEELAEDVEDIDDVSRSSSLVGA
jgi:hypothetical protein